MRKLVLGLAAALAATGAAHADPMASAYGNTVSITYPDGTIVELFIEPDGTYKATSPQQGQVGGTWAIADGQTCFTQLDPVPAPGMSPNCGPTVDKNVGDTWDGVGIGGAPVKLTIIAGH